MVVVKQVVNFRPRANNIENFECSEKCLRLYTLHSTPYTKKRFEKTIEHITPFPPIPRSRHLLHIRTDCGC